MRRLSWLYPVEWRQLYGAELDDLLEQTPFTWQTLLDVLRGALDARFHPQRPRGGAAMKGPKWTPGPTMCSFCGKRPEQVKKLVEGPGVFICDGCIHLCTEALEQDAGGSHVGGSGPGGHPSDCAPPRRGRPWRAVWEDLGRLWHSIRHQPAWG
jgi:hypothetical protein